jgi:hypothetical protein
MAIHTRQWMARHPERSNLRWPISPPRESEGGTAGVADLADGRADMAGPYLARHGASTDQPPDFGPTSSRSRYDGADDAWKGSITGNIRFASCNRGRAFGNPARLAGRSTDGSQARNRLGFDLLPGDD